MLFFSSTSVYSWLKLLSQSEIILSFPRVCIDPRKHGLKAHQWVFVLNSLLHWAFTSANVTTGIFRLFLALTKVKRGFLKIYIYISSRSLFTFKILREKKKRSVMPKLLFREITHPVLAWLELFCKPSKPWTCLQIQSWQWLWLSLGRGQKWRLLQLELFKKEKKKPHCNSILTSVRLGFSAGCAYSSQI